MNFSPNNSGYVEPKNEYLKKVPETSKKTTDHE